MMVSIVILGTAFSTFWVATQSWEKSRRRTEMLRLLEGVSSIITRQIRSIQPPFFDYNPVFVSINDGDMEGHYDSILFLSGANPRFPKVLETSDLCEVEIFIDAGAATQEMQTDGAAADPEATEITGEIRENAGLWLRIDPTPDDDVESGGYLIELGARITSFDVRYYDGIEWLDEWYTDYEVPLAIEYTIMVTDAEGRENPMSLTRLVPIPGAERINNSSSSTMADGSTATDQTSPEGDAGQSSSGSSGSSGSPESSTSRQSGGDTGSVSRGRGSGGRR